MKNLSKKKILIFALARTGSTSLLNLLDLHDSISGVSEPFNYKNTKNIRIKHGLEDFDPSTIKNFDQLVKELQYLFKKFNCIKHVWHPSGFPFNDLYPGHRKDKYVSLNEHLLTQFDKIIFLNRRNILKRIVSGLISDQAGIWAGNINEDRKKIDEFNFSPIKDEDVAWHIQFEKSFITMIRNTMIKTGMKYYEIWYEDIFGEISGHEKIQKYIDILDFLELPANFKNGKMEEITGLLGEKMKLNSTETYLRVPNIHEIEAKFGSDENGWLMK